ncbi:precorrin-4 C(11)-methyltransferase [Curvivirga aplysinae]|uniref:precorrin-4 C(11)-methyltransferase n=1 Tax=Curvivirga aplysinae TaxID=2529852 RepID=UPI0012BB6141|nr:precorrin-4 C(11)-methyltransferase [Curvivirga aplysinae]MTI10897.1 precorrin-4 C(11)-methyltransferase [Curvivirga aplysinae]
MTVHFIGAGPGAEDLITVRGLKLIQKCKTCLFAGSLVPEAIVSEAPEGALVMDTAPMHLDQIIDEIVKAHERGEDVARVHSGDPSIYGAIGEQIRRLKTLGIPYDICPGVPAFAASAALVESELTLAGVSQTIILTRTSTRSSEMPEGEDLVTLGKSGATLAVHLSITNLAKVVRDLTPLYGEDCPVVVVYRATWPDQEIIRGNLSDIRKKVKEAKLTRTALILVGRVFENEDFDDSHLYHIDHTHVLRP